MRLRLHPHLSALLRPAPAARRPISALASLITLTLIVALAATACAEQDARIAFISDRDGNEELYVMNADGSDVTRLTDTGGHISYDHRWSPDGRRIAFASDQSGNYEIYVMNSDGSGLVRLTDNTSRDFAPHLAPTP